ncbi:tetratricopeptide repeat protein [Shewanella sp. 0m-4]
MRILLTILVANLALAGCGSQQQTQLAAKIFDPWCEYAVAGQADAVSPECTENAAKGDVDAATNLGYLYAKGMLVKADINRAMALYRVAAEQGSLGAQYSLAELYRGGASSRAKPQLARYWYEQVANQSHSLQHQQQSQQQHHQQSQQQPRYQAEAQFMLGLMYMEGNGGEKDLTIAERWLKLSSDNRHNEAPFVLGNLYLDEYANPQQAVDWYRLSAQRGYIPAMHQLGMVYIEGRLGAVDTLKAKQWLWQAATQGSPEAQVDLATLEYNGINGESDLIQVYVWLDAASFQGNDLAKQRLKQMMAKLNEQQLQQAQINSQRCIASQFQNCKVNQSL